MVADGDLVGGGADREGDGGVAAGNLAFAGARERKGGFLSVDGVAGGFGGEGGVHFSVFKRDERGGSFAEEEPEDGEAGQAEDDENDGKKQDLVEFFLFWHLHLWFHCIKYSIKGLLWGSFLRLRGFWERQNGRLAEPASR